MYVIFWFMQMTLKYSAGLILFKSMIFAKAISMHLVLGVYGKIYNLAFVKIKFTRKRHAIHFIYMVSSILEVNISFTKEFGVIIDSHLQWNFHIDSSIMKTNRTFGIITRQSSDVYKTRILCFLYFAFIRFALECRSIVSLLCCCWF